VPSARPIRNGSLAMRILQRLSATRRAVFRDKGAAGVTDAALAVLRERGDRPLFPWMHYLDVHGPYRPPPQYVPAGVDVTVADQVVKSPSQLKNVQALYDGEVRYVDADLGRLFDGMRRAGLYDAATIIVTADHGDEQWEHGQFTHGPNLYDEVLRVPFIVKRPGAAAGRVADSVSTESLTPTLVAIAGATSGAAVFQAPSLAERIEGAAARNAPVFSATGNPYEPKRAVIFDGFKYIESEATGRRELFDLARDPHEQASLASTAPEIAAKGRDLLNARRSEEARLRAQLGIVPTPRRYDPERRRQLEALGYVQ